MSGDGAQRELLSGFDETAADRVDLWCRSAERPPCTTLECLFAALTTSICRLGTRKPTSITVYAVVLNRFCLLAPSDIAFCASTETLTQLIYFAYISFTASASSSSRVVCFRCKRSRCLRRHRFFVRCLLGEYCAAAYSSRTVQESECAVQNDNVRLILKKIIKIGANRCQTLRLNASNSISVWALPQSLLGECSPDPLAGLKRPISKRKDGTGREGRSEVGGG